MYCSMAASSSAVDLWAPRLICCSVKRAKKRSTWLIHDADVGVKCLCQCGLLEWMAGGAQRLHDASRLSVERHRIAALRIEHHDADRGGLDEGLEVGPRAPLGAVGAGVGDR